MKIESFQLELNRMNPRKHICATMPVLSLF